MATPAVLIASESATTSSCMGLSLNPERLMQRISNNDPYADDAGWRWSQRYWQPCWRAYLSPE